LQESRPNSRETLAEGSSIQEYGEYNVSILGMWLLKNCNDQFVATSAWEFDSDSTGAAWPL